MPVSGSIQSDTRFECRSSETFSHWLAELTGTLAVTTNQARKLVLLGWRDHLPALLVRQFDKPMGMAVGPGQLALATRHEITCFVDAHLLAHDLMPEQPGRYDALYLPRVTYYTGDLNVHDISFADDGLWFVNSRFSCLSGLSRDFSFVPRWQPHFITDLVPEDRCHLNGLAVVDGKPKYVTALGDTNFAGGWRESTAEGGVLIDVQSNTVVLGGLWMPHSPRWHQGRLWLLNSGAGELLCFDPATAKATVVCTLPGYLRGLCLIGGFAVVGLCQIREKITFGRLPVQQRFEKLLCGLALVNLQAGQQEGTFEFTSGCTELYDVQFLPGTRCPNVLNPADKVTARALTAPDISCWLRRENEIHEDHPTSSATFPVTIGH